MFKPKSKCACKDKINFASSWQLEKMAWDQELNSLKKNCLQLTDQDYPEVMRVNPLLDWSYYHIWDYLLYYKVPYCMLYNMGYTSLGNIDNTVKNPHLLCKDFFNENEKYLPAYKLLQEGSERIGRNR